LKAPDNPRLIFMKNITSITDLHDVARRKVPRAFFDYAESGSYSESTLRANLADMTAVKLRQRVMMDVGHRDTSTTIVGENFSVPVVLSPIGLLGMQRGDGEILACRAAHEAGIQFTLSTMSICSIEDVAAAVDKPFWFQLYAIRDRGFMEALIERAWAARCSALVLTVDLQILGQRHRDIKNGMTVPPEIRLKNIIDIATKPAWALSVLKGKRKTFGNLASHVKGMENVNSLSQWIAEQFDPTLNWKDIERIKSLWPGKLILKGIMDVEDARIAASIGADALVCSNHGGRQLDGAASSISMLPKIANAVGDDIEVLFDGGVRTGMDVERALALGARGCLIGRSYVWGLGAYGQAGVSKAIDIIQKELSVTMALTGVSSIAEIGPNVLVDPPFQQQPARKKTAAKPKRRG
jgi:L-lactate dehydrogenase (cytochrome)